MDMLKPLKSLIKRGQKKVQDYFDEQNMLQEASQLREEYDLAKNEKEKWNLKFDKEEQAYQGDREFSNIYSSNTKDDARTVLKTNYMIIESQVDLSTPEPVFKAVSEDDEKSVRELQAVSDYVVRSNDMEKVNSITERECKKLGTTVYKVLVKEVNGKKKIEIINVHPKNVIPAAGTIDIDKAEIIYHAENRTLGDCIRTYGEIAKKLPSFGELADTDLDEVGKNYDSNLNKTLDTHNALDNYRRASNSPLTKYIIIEKWYIDEDGDIGLTTFSDRLILLKKPKFYYRRKFDAKVSDDGNIETLQQYDKDGNEILQYEEELDQDYVFEDKKIAKGEKIKYYIPKSHPFVFQCNVPRSKCVWGISDIEINYDLDQCMKRIIHKYEERMLKGTSKIFYEKSTEEEAANILNNEDMQIIPVTNVNAIAVKDLTYDSPQVLNFFDLMFDMSQRQLGITQVWQGFNEGEATSGKAIDSLVKQTAEKINIKVNQKNIAYKKLYRLVCDFLLAFVDEEVPYRIDSDIQSKYGKFNRKKLLKKDESGNWIYPDWDVEISAESGFPRTKTFMFDSIIELAGGGYLQPTPENVMIWKLLSKTGYPNSDAILQTIQEQVEEANAQMAMEQPTEQSTKQPMEEPTEQPGIDIKEVIKRLPQDVQDEVLKMNQEEVLEILGGGNE